MLCVLRMVHLFMFFFFFSSRRRHTRCSRDWSSDMCSSDLSLVIVGLPNFLSMTTLRPFGPSVAFTAAAMIVTPLSSELRASSSNLSCFGMDRVPPLLENGEDVFLAHDEVFLVVDLDLGARILTEQDLVAGLHVQRDLLAVVADLARPDGDHLALLRLLLGGVRDDDRASFDFLLLQTFDHDAIVQRTHLHLPAPSVQKMGFALALVDDE